MRFVQGLTVFLVSAVVQAGLSACAVLGMVLATNAAPYGAASQAGTVVLIVLVAPAMALGALVLLTPAFVTLAAMRRLSLRPALVAGAVEGVVVTAGGIFVIARGEFTPAIVAGIGAVATLVCAVGAWAGYAVWRALERKG